MVRLGKIEIFNKKLKNIRKFSQIERCFEKVLLSLKKINYLIKLYYLVLVRHHLIVLRISRIEGIISIS